MKKVLIITHLQHASPRIPGLAGYLPEFGWEPLIMTAPLTQKQHSAARIIETGYRERLGFAKKMLGIAPGTDERTYLRERLGVKSQKSVVDFFLTRIGEVVNYPDADKGWKPFGIHTGNDIIRQEKIDAIISSSSPVTAHIIASQLSRRHNLPWVADLRDLWSQNHNYSYCRVRRALDRRLELQTLSGASALVTVSQPLAHELSHLHNGKKTYTITNGFDPALLDMPPAELTEKFTITYTGTIYRGKQDVSVLFAALGKLITGGIVHPERVEVRFYGMNENWLDEEAKKYGLESVVHQYDRIPQPEALRKQRESHLLLLLNWEDSSADGWHPSKGFEYLGAQRPILATGGRSNEITKKLLNETGAGVFCANAEDTFEYLRAQYAEYVSNGSIRYNANPQSLSNYTYRAMAMQFADVIQKAGEKPKT